MILKTAFRIWAWGHLFFLIFGFIAGRSFMLFAWIPAIVISCVAFPFFVAAAAVVSLIRPASYLKVAAMALFSLLITGFAFHLCGSEGALCNGFIWDIDCDLLGIYYASLAATFTGNIICYRLTAALRQDRTVPDTDHGSLQSAAGSGQVLNTAAGQEPG